MRLKESTPSGYQCAFTEIAGERSDAIIVHARGEHLPYRQLIVELAEKSRLPAIYPWREYVEAGGLVAYGPDFGELSRHMANDVHEILNGARAGESAPDCGDCGGFCRWHSQPGSSSVSGVF